MKYQVTVPIVGYTSVEVDAANEEEAREKALDSCCDFGNEKVDVIELYGVEHVSEGNCVNHPFWNIEVEKTDDAEDA